MFPGIVSVHLNMNHDILGFFAKSVLTLVATTDGVADEPHWVTIVLGGGGIIGGFVSLFTLVRASFKDKQDNRINIWKDRAEQLSKDIERKDKDIDKILEQLEKKEKEITDVNNFFQEVIDKFTPKEQIKIVSIFSSLDQVRNDRREDVEDCITAGKYLKSVKNQWLRSACDGAAKLCRKQINRKNRNDFEADMSGYLDWLIISLIIYRHPDAPLQDFVDLPKIEFLEPYTFAIKYLKENERTDKLSDDQRYWLHRMLDDLSKKIEIDFRKTNHG
jgi:gas vesicle protein